MAFPVPARFSPPLVLRLVLAAAVIFVSSYCTHGGEDTKNVGLSDDEAYLVDTYSRIAEARSLRSISYSKSESLFAALDSTADTTRISNTIQALNLDPDRWLLVFRSIEEKLGSGIERRQSEERR